MVDASPNSAQDLEIEIVEEDSENKELLELEKEEREKDSKDERQREEETTESNEDDSSRSAKGDDSDDDRPNNDKNGDSKLNICTSSMSTKSVRSRVFVGHLNTDKATRKDIEKLFSKCGKIEAISMLSGYGFVQFDNEESALKAIDKYHGTSFFGTRLVVDKPEAWKRLDGDNPREPKPWPKDSRRSPDDDRYYHRQTSRNRRREYDYDDLPSRYRDPDYERYLEMRYMEERLAERYRYDRLYDRYPPPPPTRYPGDYPATYREMDRYMDYPSGSRGYGYLRDDDYGRDRRPFDYGYR